jgi:hypothetical protein
MITMARMKYRGTAGKPGGNRENKPHPKALGVSWILEYGGVNRGGTGFLKCSDPFRLNRPVVLSAGDILADVIFLFESQV